MSSIGTRHLERQLRQARKAWQRAQADCEEARRQVTELRARTLAAAAQATALLETMSTAILAEDQNRIITLLNQRLCDLFGLPHPPSYYLGKHTLDLVREGRILRQDEQSNRQRNQQLRQAQQRASGQLIPLQNGTILQQDYLPIVQNGVTMLHIWSYEDVTVHQRAQQRVQELSRLAEQSPQPIIRFNREAEAQYANPAATAVLTALYEPGSLDSLNMLRQEIAQTLSTGQPRTVEKRLGEEFYLWTIAPLLQEQEANVYLTTITERRRAEAELVRSQLFTARINDTVPDIVFLFDMDLYTVLYCNRQVELMLGYTEEEIREMGSQLPQLLIHPEDLATVRRKQFFLQNMGEGQVSTSEYRFQHRNGQWRWLSLKSTAFTRHPDGTVWQIVGSAADVTERRTTEEELRQSRLFVERITNTTPHLIYIYDVKTQTNVYCNRFIETMLGYSEHELQGMRQSMLRQLMPESERERVLRHFEEVARVADGQILHLEFFLYHRNGSIRWLRISNTPFERNERGQVQRIVGSAEDITRWKIADEQRRSANRRLAEQNRLFRQVIDTVPNLIYLKDGNGNYILANQATAHLYNLGNDELLQTPAPQLQQMFPDLVRYRVQDERVIQSRQEVAQEDTFTDAHGQMHWFHTIKRPFVLADGTVQVLGVDNDITELKRTGHALQEAKEAAEQNAHARQTFLTNMSHEIRTPMNGIMGLAELMAKTPLTDEQQQYLHHIRHSAEHLLVVINDILDMAQLGAGRVRLESVPFELTEVLKTSCQALMPKAAEKGISLRLQLPPEPTTSWVLGDPYRLRQILLNLLSNAIKFTDKGHVLLTCRCLSQTPDQLTYQFAVLDTGIGISEGQLQQLFEPFTQAEASTAREYGGSGLGLSISRGLVELLGGELTAESRLHHGSTFRFALRFGVAAAPAPTTPTPAPEFQRLRGCRVLLTEDNRVNQLLVQVILRNWGMEVHTASSGPEALTLFRQHHYDVVLMDIQMPGMDGIAASRLLREHPDPERAATPIVALTAHAMHGEAERYHSAGLDGYLSKPFKEEDLFQTIAELIYPQGLPQPQPEAPLPTPAPEPTTPPLPAGKLYDLSGLRRLSNNDEKFVRRLATLFINTTPPVVAELESHLQNRNLEQLGAAAHHLKSSIDGLQVQALRTVLRDLEAAAHAPDTAEWPALQRGVEQVRQTVDEVVRQLRQEFPAE
ncbi:PAS domain-containing hybrid sensor histidine kinase/response regulator [Hymenobacter sp. DG01]|uniref:PAS domain-containing hybrid sensor histidine kinase/response regulator n=1 Tax=Hymenobacter sp. DG01 TaxID=2584940 RepID=UPI0011233330|nr:PAS domain-containing hybrid sensor histidine kinase/response regulator [Hymenobacter sp. DG01]